MLLNSNEARTALICAAEERFAILAVNADSPAAITDCLEAARECGAPIMIETSMWQLKGHSFGSGDAVLGMTRYLAEVSILADSPRYSGIPVFFHTDHIKGPEAVPLLIRAIQGLEARFSGHVVRLRPSTVSLDSSDLTDAENIESICRLCAVATEASQDITLEMEAGLDDGLTSLETAGNLLSAVHARHPGRIHLWAPGVGTQHGFSAQGYPGFSSDAVAAHRRLATEICGHPVGIALHGSSGLPNEALQAGVKAGAIKVNWSSESLLLRSHAAREYYALNKDRLEKSHPEFKNHAMDNGVQRWVSQRYIPRVAERIRTLGGEGRASGILQQLL